MTLAEDLGLELDAARVAYGTLFRVAAADGQVGSAGANLLRVAALELGLEPTRLPESATADDLRRAFPSPTARRALVDALLIPACIDGQVSPAREAVVRDLATALDTPSHWVELLAAIRRGSTFGVKRQLVRRSPDARRLFRRIWQEEGWRGLWVVLLFLAERYVDPTLAARFRALETLAEGTLGRAFFEHVTSRGLAFPGEPKGLPERMLHHDLMHVMNGYGTDPAGECEVGGFYAGFCEGDAFTFIVTTLTTFHLGMRVSPALVTPTRGAFDPARVIAAFKRGRRLRVDVMGPWDYWALMPLPMDEARAVLGIGDEPASAGDPSPARGDLLIASPSLAYVDSSDVPGRTTSIRPPRWPMA